MPRPAPKVKPADTPPGRDAAVARLAEPFAAFTARFTPGRPVVVLCHSDADGLAAGAILVRALRLAGHTAVAEVTGKGGGAWSPGTAEALAAHQPQALIVADLGCRPVPVLPGVPTLFLDHHRPDGVPPGDTLVTGHGTEPTPTSGHLAWECGRLVADVDALDWIAGVSILSDINDAAPFDMLRAAKVRHGVTKLRDATSLLNAPRRSATGDARPALDLLLRADGPRAITDGTHGETATLKAAKDEVSAAFAEAKKVGPKFAGVVALVRVDSPCQVHPMVAQIWRTRLPKSIVMVANCRYIPGQVNFSMRSATGVNLLDFLRERTPAGAGEQYGKGHDQATGGALPFPVWNEWAAALGFGPEAHADETGWAGGAA